MKNKIEFIAFDADDTLWENELYFQELEHKFCHLLRKYSPAPSVSEELFKTEGGKNGLGYSNKKVVVRVFGSTILAGRRLFRIYIDIKNQVIFQGIFR